MLNLDSAAVAAALPYAELIEALNAAFASEVEAPVRAHHEVPVPDGTPGNLLLMPAWRQGDSMGVKVVTVSGKSGQLAPRARINGCAALSSPTDAACTTIPPTFADRS